MKQGIMRRLEQLEKAAGLDNPEEINVRVMTVGPNGEKVFISGFRVIPGQQSEPLPESYFVEEKEDET